MYKSWSMYSARAIMVYTVRGLVAVPVLLAACMACRVQSAECSVHRVHLGSSSEHCCALRHHRNADTASLTLQGGATASYTTTINWYLGSMGRFKGKHDIVGAAVHIAALIGMHFLACPGTSLIRPSSRCEPCLAAHTCCRCQLTSTTSMRTMGGAASHTTSLPARTSPAAAVAVALQACGGLTAEPLALMGSVQRCCSGCWTMATSWTSHL